MLAKFPSPSMTWGLLRSSFIAHNSSIMIVYKVNLEADATLTPNDIPIS